MRRVFDIVFVEQLDPNRLEPLFQLLKWLRLQFFAGERKGENDREVSQTTSCQGTLPPYSFPDQTYRNLCVYFPIVISTLSSSDKTYLSPLILRPFTTVPILVPRSSIVTFGRLEGSDAKPSWISSTDIVRCFLEIVECDIASCPAIQKTLAKLQAQVESWSRTLSSSSSEEVCFARSQPQSSA